MLTQLMAKLIELKTINKSLFQKQELIEKYTKSVLDLDLSSDSVVDEIKVCRSDVNIIELKQKSEYLKCFWPKCQFKTPSESHLKTHELIHKNEKRFECNECHKQFIQLSHLKRHQSVHSNERPFVCDWSQCGKGFKMKTDLKYHKRYT